jgi:hypothetical protein
VPTVVVGSTTDVVVVAATVVSTEVTLARLDSTETSVFAPGAADPPSEHADTDASAAATSAVGRIGRVPGMRRHASQHDRSPRGENFPPTP